MAFQNHQLHFLLVPLMSQSHLIPFTDMAKLLAHRGLTVTIVMTPLNAIRHNQVLEYAQNFNLKIKFLSLPFPCQEAGLPEGCENRDSLPSPDFIPRFFKASDMLQEPLEKWLQELESQPNCIISDICLPWIADTAVKFKILRIVFHGISCFCLLCSHNLSHHKVFDKITSDSEKFSVPETPDKVEFIKPQLPESRTQHSSDFKARLQRFKKAELSSEGVVVNTFQELEPDYVKGYKKVVRNLWCIGPLSNIQNKNSKYKHQCLKFLDSRKQSSVLYVCFGSLCHIITKQLIELALGLEASKHSFIWVVKEDDYTTELDKWLVQENFQERVKDRGLVVKGWVPQVLILSHSAIGGFLTHCGWNSTLEGISSGLPMITWPMFAEQFSNEKLIVQVLKIGVRIGVEIPMSWGEEEKLGVMVNKDEIKKAIDQLMDEGIEGEDRRKKAQELGKMAKYTIEEGGSSYLNMTLLIQHVIEQITDGNQSNYNRK